MNYLGIDFGLSHLGLSIAQSPLAEPLAEKTYQTLDQAAGFILHLCQDHQIEALVLGLPEGKLAPRVRELGFRLSRLANLPVYYQDETLSTIEAKQKLLAAHASQKKRRQDHSAAATLILQDYLDSINI